MGRWSCGALRIERLRHKGNRLKLHSNQGYILPKRMKGDLIMLKRRILVFFTLVFLCLCSLCSADQRAMEKYLPALQGNWYDLDGNVVLAFDGASVNGCPVVDILRVAGGGGDVGFTVRLVEEAGYRDLKLSCMGLSTNPEEYHQYIRLDGRQKLL